jgi:peptide-methionine (S)-S-oxide reductase
MVGKQPEIHTAGLEVATLAGGCFWCLEAVYDQIQGVEAVASGYIGGQLDNPTYEAVCSGRTGHAEAVRIAFNPQTISYRELVEIFFVIHDPTTLNRQGNDIGTQYRSAIFYHSEAQKKTANALIATFNKEKLYPAPIVTEGAPATTGYEA